MMKYPHHFDICKAAMTAKVTNVPFYVSTIAAGFPSPVDEGYENGLDLNQYCIANPPATFFVRATGDSMINAGIHSGDLLIVDRSREAGKGKIIIAVLNGEFTVKRLHKDNTGQVSLLSENPHYKPIVIQETDDFRIWGVVTAVIHTV